MSDADLSGTVLDQRYQVIEPIAQGAMGSVYRGERVGLGRAVAIKVMHQELPDELASRQRFEREAKLMAKLEHPNCVSVIDFGLHDDKPYLVMDLIRGTSLLDLLEKQPRLDAAKASDIIRQVLSGLAHAHELGIVHRDIKPANIMISEKAGLGQQVRILDFGLARLVESSTKLTTGIVVGTPNYMAPEQCKGSDVDARTDVYACGVMLFEMLTGRKPFVADDPIVVVRKHLLEAPPTLASLSPGGDFGDLEAVVAKALAKVPADRYASAVEMSKAVEVAAAKVVKTSTAALYARAVPEKPGVPENAPQATMSGWSVPPEARSSALPPTATPATPIIPGVTATLPTAPAAISGVSRSIGAGDPAGPTGGIASVGNASGPFTGVARVDATASAGTSGPSMSGAAGAPGAAGASGPLGPSGPSMSGAAGAPGAAGASGPSGPSMSGATGASGTSGTPGTVRGDASSAAPPVSAGSLPPLPTAGPYVPPAGVGPKPGGLQFPARPATAPTTPSGPSSNASAATSTTALSDDSLGALLVPSGPPPTPSVSSASSAASASSASSSSSSPSPVSMPSSDGSATIIDPPQPPPPTHSNATDAFPDFGQAASSATPASGGMPDRALDVPPTRPTAPGAYGGSSRGGDYPIPQLPLTRKQLMMAGGGLLALIVFIALVAGGGSDDKKKTASTKPTQGSASTATTAIADDGDAAAKAKSLIASEQYGEAVTLLKAARKSEPENAELAFLAGKAYFGQLWWGDGVESFRAAIKLDPSYRENPELLKAVLKGFLTTPEVDDRIVRFMRSDIGLPMRKYLEETAEKHPKPPIRARARAELNAR